MSAHTPGPWDFVAEDGQGCFVYTTATTRPGGLAIQDDDIAEVVWRGTYLETNANARLIAAAPDLLEALKRARPYMDEYAKGQPHWDLSTIDAAIAKAEGRS